MMHYPTIFYDELVYLGAAHFFSGTGPMPNLYNGGWGHLGYSAVITPAFWLFRTFPHQFHAVLVINALLMTSIYPLLYLVLKRLSIQRSSCLTAVTFAVSVYPSFLLYSDFAFSENLLTPLFLLILVLYARFLERPHLSTAIALGMGAVAAYVAHSRGLSIIALIVLFGLFLACRKRVPWPSAITLVAIGILGIALIEELKHLIEVQWPPTLFPRGNVSLALSQLGTGLFGMVLLGQIVYLAVTTFGIYINGIVYLVAGDFKARPDSKILSPFLQVRRDLISFILGIHVCVLIGAAIFISTLDPLSRPDYFLMGRYIEPLVPVILGAGVLLIAEAGVTIPLKRLSYASIASFLLVVAAGALLLGPALNWSWLGGAAVRANFLSFMPLYRAIPVDNAWIFFALPSAIAVLAVFGGLLRRPAIVIWSIAAIFAVEAIFYSSRDVRIVESLPTYDPSTGSVTRIGPLLNSSNIAGQVDVDAEVWEPFKFSHWQLFAGNRTFVVFQGKASPKSLGPLVIAGNNWDGSYSGYRNSGCEDDRSTCLWIKAQ